MAAAPHKDSAREAEQARREWETIGSRMRDGCRVYKRSIAIRDLMFTHCRVLVADPEAWARGEPAEAARTNRRDIFSPLRSTLPPLSYAEQADVCRRIDKLAPKFLERFFVADPASAGTDFSFLASLGLSSGRNWRAGCAVCQAGKIMGTTCGCGHTEIAVFRPCGHSLCAVPCFAELFKHHLGGGPLRTETTKTADGRVFSVVGKIDIRSCRGFPCPLCRAVVQSVFRAEDVYLPADAWTDADAAGFADLCRDS